MNYNRTLSDLTKDIVVSRKSSREKFDECLHELKTIQSLLNTILSFDNKTLWSEIITENKNDDLWSEIRDKSRLLNQKISKFIGKDGDFTIAYNRASRSFVNIGSIGIMREGKSEFVAQTTNLNKWVLPRKKGEHACTTTSINVINGVTSDGKSEIARVYYYTVNEMVHLYGDYLDEFGLDRSLIDEKIHTREELKNWCDNNKETMESLIPSTQSKLKKKFLEYLDKIGEYVGKLVEIDGDNQSNDNNHTEREGLLFEDYKISEIKQGGNKAKTYYSSVSYYQTPDSISGSEVFTSFATSKAEIYTMFDVDGEVVDNIQFLDTPGIGEKKVGVDRILSDAVAMNLDVIIAIRALNGSAKEEQEQAFVNILRSRLNGKDSAKDWIYYLLNIWDGQDYQTAQTCINDLNYLLTTGEDSSSISLEDDHYRVINLHDGYQVFPDNTTDSNNPIGKYLKQILSDLIPKISKIDNDFSSKALTDYGKIVKKYKELQSLLRLLNIPEYDDYERINKQIDTLQVALASECAKNPKIFTEIQHNIDDFCELRDGELVARVFKATDLNFHDSDTFYDKNKQVIQTLFDEGSYNSNYDFQTYSNLKLKLMEVITDDIQKRVNPSDAEKKLLDTKESVASVFIKEGKLGFITTDKSQWFIKVLEYMNNEGCYPNMVSLITPFAEHEIQAMEMVKPHISSVVLNSIHHDDFGDPNEYDFEEYDNATMAIVHSLFAIERYAKGLINDSLISSDIKPLQDAFSTIYYKLTKFAASTDPHLNNCLRKELYHFYKNHSAEIFKGEKSLQKMGLAASWKNIIKQQ